MTNLVMWWGEVTCSAYEAPSARRQRTIDLARAAGAAGVLVGATPGDDGAPAILTVRWQAVDDLNEAFGRLFDLTRIEPGDFNRRPETVATAAAA